MPEGGGGVGGGRSGGGGVGGEGGGGGGGGGGLIGPQQTAQHSLLSLGPQFLPPCVQLQPQLSGFPLAQRKPAQASTSASRARCAPIRAPRKMLRVCLLPAVAGSARASKFIRLNAFIPLSPEPVLCERVEIACSDGLEKINTHSLPLGVVGNVRYSSTEHNNFRARAPQGSLRGLCVRGGTSLYSEYVLVPFLLAVPASIAR